jgi:hypothetical protein
VQDSDGLIVWMHESGKELHKTPRRSAIHGAALGARRVHCYGLPIMSHTPFTLALKQPTCRWTPLRAMDVATFPASGCGMRRAGGIPAFLA